MKAIDVTFQMTNDTKPNKDPDTFSQTLNNYHKMLCESYCRMGRFFHSVKTLLHLSIYRIHRI